jgi:hypothetical protein
MNIGLAAPAAVQWLLRSESDVYDAVRAFITGRLDRNVIDVAGPPTGRDLALYYERKGQVVPLPCVRLHCRMVRHHLTGAPGVEVTCSDRDLEEIKRWNREATLASLCAT